MGHITSGWVVGWATDWGEYAGGAAGTCSSARPSLKSAGTPSRRNRSKALERAVVIEMNKTAIGFKIASPEAHVDIERAEEGSHPPPATRDGQRAQERV